MIDRHRHNTRARRLLGFLLPLSVDRHIATALTLDDDLMALADALFGADGQRQAELIAACDQALWELEFRGAE